MKTQSENKQSFVGLAILCLFALGLANAGWAVVKSGPPNFTDKPAATSEKTYQKLMRIQKLVKEKDYSSALELLTHLQERTKANFNEHSQVLNATAHLHLQKEDYKSAASTLEKIVALPKVPREVGMRSLYTLGQLHMYLGNLPKAAKLIEQWISYSEKPSGEAYASLAAIYSENKQFNKAFKNIEKAFATGETPKKNWYQLYVFLLYDRQNFPKATQVLTKMLASFPEEQKAWVQLVGLHLEAEDYKNALMAAELAYYQGHLTKEKEIIQLARLLYNQGIPIKAAKILEVAIADKKVKPEPKNLVMEAEALIAAKELEQGAQKMAAAAKQSADPKHHLLAGQVYMELENWPQAITHLNKALEAKSGAQTYQIYLAIGVSKAMSDDLDGAKVAFERAMKADKENKSAIQWLSHIEQKLAASSPQGTKKAG